MPVYNGENYIRQSLDSLLAQTFSDFELIISDNASVDQTSKICLDYASLDSRVCYIRQELNIGALENFQYVLNRARGEYFMWAAHDDVWDFSWIESMLSVFESKGEFMAFGSLRPIDSSGSEIHQPWQSEDFSFSGKRLFRRIKFFASTPGAGKANIFYGLIKTSLLKSVRLADFQKYDYGADMLFLYALLEHVSIVRPRLCSSYYKRIHADAASAVVCSNDSSKSIVSAFRTLLFSLGEPLQRLLTYSSFSTKLEVLIMLILLPSLLIHNALFLVYRRAIRFIMA